MEDFLSTFPILTSTNDDAQMVYFSSFHLGVVKPKPKFS